MVRARMVGVDVRLAAAIATEEPSNELTDAHLIPAFRVA
jgi:hypothetical protein